MTSFTPVPAVSPPSVARVRRAFSLTRDDLVAVNQWSHEQDQVALERQRATMDPTEFAMLTQDGKFPYYGAIDGGQTFCFMPAEGGYAIQVKHSFTRQALALPVRVHGADAGVASYEFEADEPALRAWAVELGLAGVEELMALLEFEFTPTGLGVGIGARYPSTGERRGFTDYASW